MSYQCPICHQPLILIHKSLSCANKHSFDLAKEGYVNLMPVQHKHSKQPGDSQEMMLSRRAFLDAGYYQPLRADIYTLLRDHLADNANTLLDIGCGEGYYTAMLAEELQQTDANFKVYGLDIAKGAIRLAAKRYPQVNFCVASSYRLPFTDHSMAAILRIYAPSEPAELKRVLNNKGVLVTVTPAANHLRQLKAMIYDNVQLHDANAEMIVGFTLQKQHNLSYTMSLEGQQGFNLLQMTPFAWRANPSVMQKLKESELFICDADFNINVYTPEE